MRELGISIYPDYFSLEDLKQYIKLAKKYHMTRAFTSLQLGDFGFQGGLKSTDPVFKDFFTLCNESGITVCADTTDVIFKDYGATPNNLKPFYDVGLKMVRIDGGFTSDQIIEMTNNPYGIKIEMNASFQTIKEGQHSDALDLMENVSKKGNIDNLVACFNYFPRIGTGHSIDYLKENIKVLKQYGIKITAFVASQYSPHNMQQNGHGLMSIEAHRYVKPWLAAQELFVLGVDAVLIGCTMASQKELQQLSMITSIDHLEIPVIYNEYVPQETIDAIGSQVMSVRGDRSASVIRSMELRGHKLAPLYCAPRNKYDVTVDNSDAVRYVGELQIMMEDQGQDATVNVVGMIAPEGRFLLPYVLEHCVPYKLIPFNER